jgi:hypothetical protein
MGTDDVATTLAGIKERNEQYITTLALTEHTAAGLPCGDVRLLLAALEAALTHHVEAVIEDMPVPRFRYCKTCTGHPKWPCPEVRAITAALTGEEASDGG